MLTAEGCRHRRERLWDCIGGAIDGDEIVLADPIHLRYLANFDVTPFSLGGDYGGILRVRRDGSCVMVHDNRMPHSVDAAHVEERAVIQWYDGKSPGRGPRREALYNVVAGGRVHDAPGDAAANRVVTALGEMRRAKDADELAVLARCMRAGEAGHAWARANVAAGMTELDVYVGIFAECVKVVGSPVVVYGDFAVSPGPERRGGPPTDRVLVKGDLLILDFSVVIAGYRGDFTNTICVGGAPTTEQTRLFELCQRAMAAGEADLKAGAACQRVDDAVRGTFAAAGMAEHFGHHAGHGLGLAHPEAPFFVPHATEVLQENDIVTLEPGLYVSGVGGIRIEHNYRVTAGGFERLSRHVISLV